MVFAISALPTKRKVLRAAQDVVRWRAPWRRFHDANGAEPECRRFAGERPVPQRHGGGESVTAT